MLSCVLPSPIADIADCSTWSLDNGCSATPPHKWNRSNCTLPWIPLQLRMTLTTVALDMTHPHSISLECFPYSAGLPASCHLYPLSHRSSLCYGVAIDALFWMTLQLQQETLCYQPEGDALVGMTSQHRHEILCYRLEVDALVGMTSQRRQQTLCHRLSQHHPLSALPLSSPPLPRLVLFVPAPARQVARNPPSHLAATFSVTIFATSSVWSSGCAQPAQHHASVPVSGSVVFSYETKVRPSVVPHGPGSRPSAAPFFSSCPVRAASIHVVLALSVSATALSAASASFPTSLLFALPMRSHCFSQRCQPSSVLAPSHKRPPAMARS